MAQGVTYRGYGILVDKAGSGYIARILSPDDTRGPAQVDFDFALGETREKAVENVKLKIDKMVNAFWETGLKAGDRIVILQDRDNTKKGMKGIVRGVDQGRPPDRSTQDQGSRWVADVKLEDGEHVIIHIGWDFQKY